MKIICEILIIGFINLSLWRDVDTDLLFLRNSLIGTFILFSVHILPLFVYQMKYLYKKGIAISILKNSLNILQRKLATSFLSGALN